MAVFPKTAAFGKGAGENGGTKLEFGLVFFGCVLGVFNRCFGSF